MLAAVDLRERVFPRAVIAQNRWAAKNMDVWLATTKTGDVRRQRMVAKAKEAEISNELFAYVTSPYWIEALAAHLVVSHELTGERLEALLKIQAERDAGLKAATEWFRMGGLLAAAVAIFGFAAAQIPKESFALAHVGSRGYGEYRVGIALVFALIVGYIVAMRTLTIRKLQPRRRKYVRLVLDYCALCQLPRAASQQPAE